MGEFLSLYGLTTFDAIAILVIVIFTIVGFIKGFVRELSNLIATVISFIVAKIVATPLAPILMEKLQAEETIRAKLVEIVSSIDTSSVDAFQSGLLNKIWNIKGIGNLIRNVPIDSFDITNIIQKNLDVGDDISGDIANLLYNKVEPIMTRFFNIMAFVIAFIVLFIVLSIIMALLAKLIEKIAFVGAVNTILGGVIGLVKAIIFIAVVFSLVYVIFTFTDSPMIDTFTSSKLFSLVGSIKEYIKI